MILFSARHKFEQIFNGWRRKYNEEHGKMPSESPANVISYLQTHGLLNEEKFKKHIDENT